ncbi:MAG: Acylneuraminate cytidylyltransferase [Parcubacteria group bacterium GW2011_GWA2_47_64]|nr:MAG: Acylneuraminate cytidylyltransferase [Parcubacteria group bacterium GW2011_GWA2_47_64]KKU96527.1 MAG: Acylneuraminate cytidylyltransferase [Parcubacteria group bacterium GW2011_GWC2_48_17]
MNILAVIPARGGSKGILNKNIRVFGGKPLLSHTIDAAKKSRYVTRTVVSTESMAIASVARKYGAEVPFLRPIELAQDRSKATDAVYHLLTTMEKESGYMPDYVVLLQPTSPLRTSADIDGALDLLFKRKAGAIVSVCRTEQLLFVKDKKGALRLVSDESFLKSGNRQELPDTYKLDGSMVYAIKTSVFLKKKTFIPKGVLAFEIPRWRAVDIDEPQDFIVGELIYRNRKKIEHALQTFR